MPKFAFRNTTAAFCTAVLVLGLSTTAMAADNVAPPLVASTVALSVTVTDPNGVIVPNAVVKIGALPIALRTGNLSFDTVGSAKTDTHGVARVLFDLKDSRRYLGFDGSVDLRITGWSSDGQLSVAYSTPAYFVEGGWKVPSEDNPLVSLAARESAEGRQSGQVQLKSIQLRLSPTAGGPSENPLTRTQASGAENGALALPFRACKGIDETEALVATSYYATSWLPVKRLETKSRSRMKYEWSSSFETKFTVALNGVNGGLASSTIQTSSAGFSYTSPNNANSNIDMQWQYRQYDIRCYNASIGQYVADTGKDEWRPYTWTGGTRISAVSGTQFTCNGGYQTGMAANTWVTRTTTTTYTNGATLAGVTLTQSQHATSTHKLTVIPNSGQSASICGSNAVPINAAKVKEI